MKTLKIVIPTAGFARRMRPQTWSKPKPLVSVAGKTALDHLLDTFHTIPAGIDVEYDIIVGPGFGEQQIPVYIKKNHPDLKVNYVLQPEMHGQSDAFYQARKYLTGPVLLIYADTLIETDFSLLENEEADVVAWVKQVPDPRRFGVAELDSTGRVTHLVEKPDSFENNLAVVGCYFFKSSKGLIAAFEEQFRRKVEKNGEYFLADAINILIEQGAKVRTKQVDVWLDTGTIEATLATNRYLLDHGRDNTASVVRETIKVIPPVFIHESADVRDSVIGPNVSIGPGCKITNAHIEDSIIEADVTIDLASLKSSFIGREAQIQGHAAEESIPMVLNIGDNSSIVVK
jgi:glucose-1-phosphate thymidylyltransferase